MTTATASKWVRVTKHNPCPICGKPDWCLTSEDGKSAICARTESDKPAGNKGAGWLHTLNSSNYQLDHYLEASIFSSVAPPFQNVSRSYPS